MTGTANHPALSPVQRTAAQLLGRGLTIAAVAEVVGVEQRTIYRWKQRDDFQDEVTATREIPVRDPRGVLIDALTARKDDKIDWTNRVKAAMALMELDAKDDPANVTGQSLPRKLVLKVVDAEPGEEGVIDVQDRSRVAPREASILG